MNEIKPVYCPMCSKELNKIAKKRYYCFNCEKELFIEKGKAKVYDISEKGVAHKIAEYEIELEEPHEREPTDTAKKKIVVQLDKDTLKELNRFATQQEAKRITGVHDSGISSCINGRSKTAGGYVWRCIYV